MAKLGFCGLGQMGRAMAARLMESGHELTVWNRSPGPSEELTARGAKPAASPAGAAASSDAVITMLADARALDEVVFGDGGLAEGLEPGSTLIEMSTVGPDAVRDLAGRLPEGVEVIDAPVLGSVPQAEKGELDVFVGGPPDALSRWKDVFEALGSPMHVGPLGSGAAMKLVTNSVLGVLMAGLGEALALADALGLATDAVLEVLARSPLGATASKKRRNVESGRYPPNFKLKLAAKDMALVAEAADKAGARLEVARAVRAYFEDARRAGLGELDYSAVVAHMTGRPAREGPAPSA